MDSTSWVDNRTLLLCLCILLAVFSAMMIGLRSFYPRLPGIDAVTTGFCLGTVATLLFVPAGWLPISIPVAGGGGAAFLSSIFLYRGLLEFFRAQASPPHPAIVLPGRRPPAPSANLLPILYFSGPAAEALLIYWTIFRPNPAGCIVAITAVLALGRYLMAWTLFRAAAGRRHILAFAGTMLVFGMLASAHAVSFLFSARSIALQVMQHDVPQCVTLALSTALVCVQGIFYLMMFAGSVADGIEEQAQLDLVSCTLNRRGIECALTAEVARTQRSDATFAVLLIDVDRFKSVNDQFGHAAGDEALRRVAAAIARSIRAYDVLGRFGGDEFLLLLPQTGSGGAMMTAERLREAVRAETGLPGDLRLTLSVGVTVCSRQEPPPEILARADQALYRAKHAGRDGVRLILPDALAGGPAAAAPEPESHAETGPSPA